MGERANLQNTEKGYALYLHIPFCHGKCRYCVFYSAPGHTAVPEAYVQALLWELSSRAPAGRRPTSVYFGGGTPSLLSPQQVAALLAAANPLPGAEITLELNPEQGELARLRGYRDAGVNRLSVGVQTASDESLRRLGRLHTAALARSALGSARRAGFDNISGDIMLALPGYTLEEMQATVTLLAQEGATHVSSYLLKIEEGTPFGRNAPQNLPDEDRAADFYLAAVEALAQAGFAQYEISSFAKPGFEGRHNLGYWDCGDYLGLGPAAHSSMGGRRFYFPADTESFMAGTLQPVADGEVTAEEYVMLQLRLATGVNFAEAARRFDYHFNEKQRRNMAAMAAGGLGTLSETGFSLTAKGMLVQNAVLEKLL